MFDECFKLMQLIRIKTDHPVKVEIWSDGSGNVEHNGVERRFGDVPILCAILRKLESQGFMP